MRWVAAILTLAAVACRGPVAPLEVAMGDRLVDVLLGERVRVVSEVVPPAVPIEPFPFPGRQEFPLPGFPRGPAIPCDPPQEIVIPPERSASRDPYGPPAPATYTFDTIGAVLYVEPGGEPPGLPPDPGDIPLGGTGLPLRTTRTIDNVRALASVPSDPTRPGTGLIRSFTFDVVWQAGDRTSVSAYRIAVGPRPPLPNSDPGSAPPEASPGVERLEGAGLSTSPGLFLTRADSGTAAGFRLPAPGMKLVDFPIVAGASFSASATDGVTTVDYSSSLGFSPVAVNACGSWIEGWPVTLTGTVVSADPEYLGHQLARFTARYVIGPQYGGLAIDEYVTVTTTDAAGTLPAIPIRITRATIASPPRLALAPEEVG